MSGRLVTGSDVHQGPRRPSSSVDDRLQEDTGDRQAHRGAATVAQGSDAQDSDETRRGQVGPGSQVLGAGRREQHPDSGSSALSSAVSVPRAEMRPRPPGSNDCSLSRARLTGHQVPCQRLRLHHLISSSFYYFHFTGGKHEVPGHVSPKRWRRVGPRGSRAEATPLPVTAPAPDAPRLSPVAPLLRPQASATAPWWPASSAPRNRSTTSGAKP